MKFGILFIFTESFPDLCEKRSLEIDLQWGIVSRIKTEMYSLIFIPVFTENINE